MGGSCVILISYATDIPPETQTEGQDQKTQEVGGETQRSFLLLWWKFDFCVILLTLSAHGLKAAASGVGKAASSPWRGGPRLWPCPHLSWSHWCSECVWKTNRWIERFRGAQTQTQTSGWLFSNDSSEITQEWARIHKCLLFIFSALGSLSYLSINCKMMSLLISL